MSTRNAQELRVVSTTPETTAELAALLAAFLRPSSALCLTGDLGAGKTTFVAGLASALGSDVVATSPTFTLENRYPIEHDARELVHVDLYRPDDMDDAQLLASLQEARSDGAIVAVEWGGNWLERLAPCLEIALEVGDAGDRVVTLRSHPPGWKRFDALRAQWMELAA